MKTRAAATVIAITTALALTACGSLGSKPTHPTTAQATTAAASTTPPPTTLPPTTPPPATTTPSTTTTSPASITPPPTPAQPHTPPPTIPAQPAATPGPGGGAGVASSTTIGTCSIRTNSGNCYKAGEFCRKADVGKSTTDAAGRPITCGFQGSESQPHWHY